ncbi:hypothetical protein ABBQ32_001148 [Trebouxia sp. C0010 RCD-2024]
MAGRKALIRRLLEEGGPDAVREHFPKLGRGGGKVAANTLISGLMQEGGAVAVSNHFSKMRNHHLALNRQPQQQHQQALCNGRHSSNSSYRHCFSSSN